MTETAPMLVYGAGEHLSDLLEQHPNLAGQIARIFDKDKEKVGKDVMGIGKLVESPFAMWTLPKGTRIAVSAIRYFEEIVKELKKLNPGLICLEIDQAYKELQCGEFQSLPQWRPATWKEADLWRRRGQAAQMRWRQQFLMECCACRHVWWGVRGVRAEALRKRFSPMMVAGDVFVDEDGILQGDLLEGLPICIPDALKDIKERYHVIVLTEEYEQVRDLLASYGFVENVDFVEGRKLIGEDENGELEMEVPSRESMIVYGAGAHLADMLEWSSKMPSYIARVIDKDPKKQGKPVPGLAKIIVEAPDVLQSLPFGTTIAISAIRYFDEISKELRAMNPGLDCEKIDKVYAEMVEWDDDE